ncbi:MAG TPA: hypothetical protein VFQ20_02985 [Burkholderiaceae bacterium]|nr:hypothetical protein [Burkholderiaceae bacterium]
MHFVLLPPLIALALVLPATAAPFRPTDDAQVLERVAPRATADVRARETAALRAQWQREPRNVELAVQLARRWFDDGLAQGDPRFIGRAQAVLAPWWKDAAPPNAVRVQRARLLQYGHRFDEALADLDAVLADEADNAEAWATAAAIRMVRADYAGARRACVAAAPLTTPLLATGCSAYADALAGRADEAARALATALAAAPADTGTDARLWALTRQAEIEELRGNDAAAETAYRAAVALDLTDVYLQAAYADFLLDRGRAADALALLAKADARADVILLRLALAAKASGDARGAAWTRELAARFDAARARGDTTHEKEESRFALALQGDPKRALALARANYEVQREVADARALLEAALAAKDAAAAAPVLEWMRAHGVPHPKLRALAAQVAALK